MNNLYIILCLVNIIAIQILALPTKTETVYNVVTRNFTTTCPTFSQNILVNLSNCSEITLKELPTQMTMLNMNVFYCVGMMIADLELCNSIALHDDKFLPKSPEELNAQITVVKHQNASNVCTQLKSMKIFSSSNTIPKELNETMNELKEKLSGPYCSVLCTDINGGNLNDFCAMLYYLNSQFDNVTKVDIPNKETKTISDNISQSKQQNHQEEQKPAFTHAVNESNQQQHSNVSKVGQTRTESVNPPIAAKEQLTNQKQISVSQVPVSKTTSPPETKKMEKPTSPPAEQEKGKPQPQPVPKNQIVETPKENKPKEGVQTPVESKGETQPQNPLTNEASNDKTYIKSDFTSAEDKGYPPTSTAVNYVKSETDNIDENEMNNENEDGDDDEDFTNNKWPKEINADTQNEELLNRNSPINKQVTEDLEESNFFSYFMFISVMFIAGYVVYHNKQKIMALLLEGRRDRNSRRRPSTSSYRKLNSNLEEAVTSKCSGSASHVIY